jgi:ribonuclease J
MKSKPKPAKAAKPVPGGSNIHTKDLVLLPLGGAGEIGMNCYAYGLGTVKRREWLMVDLGVRFGGEREPGVDVLLPDIGFMKAQRSDLKGLVITHGHEDHIGAVAWLWPDLKCEVHCTAFAAELLKLKLKEHGLDDEVPIKVHQLGHNFTLGGFRLNLVPVTHSIPQSCALTIETDVGRVVHSGDWKIDRTPVLGQPFDEKPFVAFAGETGVDAFVCDSTNVLREGFSPSESEVAATLDMIVANAKGRVAITTFASHVERISAAVKAARKAGREVVIAGRAMRNTIEAARICGMLKDAGAMLDDEEYGYLPPDKVLLLCTGSQGEPRAALARIAEDSHQSIALEEGDLVIFSARTIPGNEKAVGAVVNGLSKLGVTCITSDDSLVHSSGHPRQGELAQMYGWLKPKVLIPVHGEPRHMYSHVRFAKEHSVPDAVYVEDGNIVRLAPGPAAIVDEGPVGVVHVDGRLKVPSEDGPARQRRRLSFNGIVVVNLTIDKSGELESDPEFHLEGVPLELLPELVDVVEEAVRSIPRARRKSKENIIETTRSAIRRMCDMSWGKKPVVVTVVNTV